MHKRLATIIFLLFLTFEPSFSQGITGQELLNHVKRIEGKSPADRKAYIKDQLRRLKVRFQTMPFRSFIPLRDTTVTGENIIVPMGKGKKRIVVGAHSDAVPLSPGANDNGGGVAVVLGLIKSLGDHPWKYTVDFCFFDQEEIGLVGSKEYVKKYKDKENHVAMINLDVEGTGEELYVGPVGGGDDDMIMPLVRKAAQRLRFPLQERAAYPDSDHESFGKAKLENISVSVVPKGDADKLVAVVTGQRVDATNYPEVLKVMHSPRDSAKYVTAKALQMSFEFTKTVLILLNESGK